MRLIKRQGLILFTCLFAALLLIHSTFGFYHRSLVNEYAKLAEGSSPNISDTENASLVSVLNKTPENNTASSEKAKALENSLTAMTVLQILMVLSGFPLAFF